MDHSRQAQPTTIPEMLGRAAATSPDKTAVEVVGGERVTFADLAHRASVAGGALREAGAGPGDRVAVLMRNGGSVFDAHLGAAWIGAIAVPVGPTTARPLLEQIVADARPRVGVADREFRHVLTSAGLDVIELGAGSAVAATASPDDIAVIIYTSGTTGTPRGVCLSHDAILHNAETTVRSQALSADDVFLTATPMHHTSAGLRLYTTLYAGQTNVVMPAFDPERWVDTIERHGVTTTIAVPTQLRRILRLPDLDPGRLRTLRLLLYGAAPSTGALIEEMRETLQCGLYHGYGLTEAAGLVTALGPRGHESAAALDPAAVGTPLPGVAIRAVDAAGDDVEPGEVGEVLVRSRKLMAGYWDRPEETAAVMAEGWLRTGDLGALDEQGALTLTGRIGDVIISGGVNIHPVAVERVIAALPGIAEVAVFGVPDPEWGEAVAAAVRLAEGAAVSADDISSHVAATLDPRMRPRRIRLVDDLPRTESGKVKRSELVARFG